ncbi:hypothetical protein F4779DRAFT_605652 [Xylariaceae sp. FL0662B]|nr:hypothetical protein F4779DRAFT_605652 [Xylariaceae sp. FL0662B]
MVTPGETAAESLHKSEIPSRTSSRRRTLNHFTRELEKYASVAGAVGKAPVITPTVSDSKVSYHTVEALLPYRKELQSAGLAVTSEEQRHRFPGQVNVASHHHGLLQSPKIAARLDGKLDGLDDDTCESSSSSPASFVQFTPPDGIKTHLMNPLPPPKAKPKPQLKSYEKRRILPWLRRTSPAKENRSNEQASKQPPQSVKDRLNQTRLKAASSPTLRDRGISRAPETRVARVSGAPSADRPPKPAKLPIKAISPKKAPCVTLSPVEIKRSGPGSCSGPQPTRAGAELGTRYSAVPKALLGKRKKARASLIQPETIKEENESSLDPYGRTKIWLAPQAKGTEMKDPIAAADQQPDDVSPPRSAGSIAPSLPYTAHYAASRPSSIERALDAVSQHLEQMEQQADTSARLYSHAPTLKQNENEKTQHASQNLSGQRASRPSQAPGRHLTGEFVNAEKKTPHPESSENKPLPPEPTREAPAPPQGRPAGSPPHEKARAQASQTEDVLNDLDVFFDYDDGDINDRDVIKGLQVAIRAAADDFYDAWVRDRTGLRIRRFLSDLKSVEDMHRADPADQHARQRRTEARRLQGIQDRKSLQRTDI